MNILTKEPAGIATVIRLGILAAVGFGLLQWTTEQIVSLMAFIEAALFLFVRQNVASAGTLKDAGTSLGEVVRVANTDGVSLVADDGGTNGIKRNGGYPPTPVIVAVIGMLSMLSACGPRSANTSPQTTVAEYGAEILKVTAAFQDTVIAYAKTNGGNATTDRIMNTIDTQVVPAAVTLRSLLVSYNAIADPALKATRSADIEAQLTALLSAYATVSGNIEIGKLASEAQVTSMRVRELAAALRLAIAQSRAGLMPTGNFTIDAANGLRFDPVAASLQ